MEILEIPELYNLIYGYLYTYPEATCLVGLQSSFIDYLERIANKSEMDWHVTRLFLVDDILHSIDDKPAVIYERGTCYWYRNGKIHRERKDETGLILPAMISSSTRYWSLGGTCIYGTMNKNLSRMEWWYIYFRQKLYFLLN